MSDEQLWRRYQAQIDALRDLPLNFELDRRHEYTAANGWHIDDYEADLPFEPPGAPLPGGPWEIAREMLREYRFPDPSIITGIFYPDRPLEDRVMLLRARFLWITFYFGVRVGGVVDNTVDGPLGRERRWGFNYQTLQGHFERGQMDFTVVKALDTGRVVFRIHAFSRAATISNLLYRIGFRLFGRWLQRRFARRSLARMQMLVRERLTTAQPAAQPVADESPPVRPAGVEPAAAAKLDEVQETMRDEG